MNPRLLHVLLIIADAQDEADIRQKLGEARNTSFAVRAASSSEALQQIAKNSFDVFLIDVAVPDSDGIRGLQRLVAAAKNTPVIILTSVHDAMQALKVVRAGRDDYVVKSRMNSTAYERVLSDAIERHGVRKQADVQLAVSRVLAESQNIAEACDGILRVLCESLKFELGEIWQLDSAANHLLPAQSWCAPSPKNLQFQALSQSIQFQFGEGLPGRVWQTRALQWIEDVTASDYFTRIPAATSARIRSAFAVPLGFFEGIFGVMAFFSRERITMDEELSNFLMSIGSQMGQFMARKIAEAERERIGKELVLILDSTSEGINGVDLAGCITFIDRSAARTLGLTPEQVVGKNSHVLFHHTRQDGKTYPESDCPLTQLLQAGSTHSTDLDYFCRMDGSQLAVSYSAVPMFEGAQVNGAVINFTDISEKHQMEIELRHAQKLEAVGGLAAGIAHEINTPIQFIGDNTGFVQDFFRDGLTMITQYEEISQQARNGAVPRELQGLLLIARGQEATPTLLERMRNFSAEPVIRQPVRMLLPNPALAAGNEPAPASAAKNRVPAVSRA
jgi:PAS domain S-box-containing protein